MSQFFNCMECGQRISTTAKECPHCKKSPHPFTCYYCNQVGKSSDCVLFESFPCPSIKRTMHKKCYDSIRGLNSEPKTFSCPICKKVSNYQCILDQNISNYRYEYKFNCTNCGHPISVYNCAVCRKPVSEPDMTMLYDYGDNGYYKEVEDRTVHAHPACAQLIYDKRRNDGICEICGRKIELSFWDKFFGRVYTRHKTCTSKNGWVCLPPQLI